MEFRIKCKNQGDSDESAWCERYNERSVTNQEQAEKWAMQVVSRFNSALRPGEQARVLLGVELGLSASGPGVKHKWEKTNLTSILKRGGVYDTYRCSECGITGKRYGLERSVSRDKKYSAQVYGCCDKTRKHLARLAKRRNE